MTRLAILIISALALAGCYKQSESSAHAGVDFEVDRLFTHDGCTVYRFWDGAGRRYFARCEGASSAGTTWTETCGKNCTRSVEVPTGQEEATP